MTAPARQRVLVVDDEPQMLVALEDLLCDDFDVFKTESAEKALKLVQQEEDIAVVISDQRMPRMCGDELFTRLGGESHATRILVTGFADLSAVIRAVNDGNIFAYVTKPWNPEDFRLMVRKAAEYFRLGRELTAERNLLRDREERLRLVFEGSAAGLFDWNLLEDRIRYSPSFGQLFGHGADWAASPWELRALVHPEDAPRLREAVSKHFERRVPFNGLEIRARVRSGDFHWFQASGQAVWDERGAATRLAGSITDITDRKRQEARIARLTRIHAVLGGITSASVRISDRELLMREACRIAVDVGKFSVALAAAPRRLQGGELRVLASHGASAASVRAVAGRFEDSSTREAAILGEVLASARPVVVNDAGRCEPAAGQAPVPEAEGAPLRAYAVFALAVVGRVDCAFVLTSDAANVFDSEELKLLEELAANLSFALEHIAQTARLDLLSYYDTLTALPNRALLRERISQTISICRDSERKFAVVLFDVDRFRQINETLGWAAGDDLLVQIARRLGDGLPSQHTLARVGANAFAILIASFDDESDVALLVEKQLQQAVKQSIFVEDTELRISMRTGIALFPSDGQEPDSLFGNAEIALRGARSTAQRYLFYAPRMNARVAEKLDLETRLRRAVEQREFLLHYQPKVRVKTRTLAGLEALIRWREPSGRLISPGEFIPVLEDTGLILEVGRWVLEAAAAEHATWLERGLLPPRIAVNVSGLQLSQDDFVQTLDTLLERFPNASSGLDLEITESVFVEDLTGSVEKLKAARRRGFQVAIDDFGTGYSSLGYLSRLPVDALKIDRSFVVRMVENPEDMSIVSTIMSLAHALELKVIAEGVETVQQAHLLRLLRCDQLQGYLVAKPMPADEIVGMLDRVFEF